MKFSEFSKVSEIYRKVVRKFSEFSSLVDFQRSFANFQYGAAGAGFDQPTAGLQQHLHRGHQPQPREQQAREPAAATGAQPRGEDQDAGQRKEAKGQVM